MSDLAKWEVRGPVRLVANDIAEWELAKDECCPLRHSNSATFHPDGKLDESRHYNPDGTIARQKYLYNEAGRLVETQFWIDDVVSNKTLYVYDNAGGHVRTVDVSRDGTRRDSEVSTYDGSGRKTTVRFFPSELKVTGFAVEGVDHAYGAPGAVTHDNRLRRPGFAGGSSLPRRPKCPGQPGYFRPGRGGETVKRRIAVRRARPIPGAGTASGKHGRRSCRNGGSPGEGLGSRTRIHEDHLCLRQEGPRG